MPPWTLSDLEAAVDLFPVSRYLACTRFTILGDVRSSHANACSGL